MHLLLHHGSSSIVRNAIVSTTERKRATGPRTTSLKQGANVIEAWTLICLHKKGGTYTQTQDIPVINYWTY